MKGERNTERKRQREANRWTDGFIFMLSDKRKAETGNYTEREAAYRQTVRASGAPGPGAPCTEVASKRPSSQGLVTTVG